MDHGRFTEELVKWYNNELLPDYHRDGCVDFCLKMGGEGLLEHVKRVASERDHEGD